MKRSNNENTLSFFLKFDGLSDNHEQNGDISPLKKSSASVEADFTSFTSPRVDLVIGHEGILTIIFIMKVNG
jgi:hypothetical protein